MLKLKNYAFTLFFFISASLSAQNIAISEIMYHCDASISGGNWIELYNYGSSATDISGWALTKPTSTAFFFPAGTVINAGEYLVAVNDPVAFSGQYPSVTNFVGTLPFGAGNNGDTIMLVDGSSVLQDKVIYLDTFPWSFAADGGGPSLERVTIPGGSSTASNWIDGCLGGSPGTAYTPCTYPIIFSEVNYNSDAAWDPGNWVELRNVSNSPVDIGNWIFKDKRDTITHQFVIPAGTVLAAHDNFVLYQDAFLFASRFSSVPAAKKAGPFNFNFSNNGELLRLYDNSGIIQFSLRYTDAAPWPGGADGLGYTLDIQDSTGDLNNGSKWANTCLHGTPAAYTYMPCTTGFEGNTSLQYSISPNPANNDLVIESDKVMKAVIITDELGRTMAKFDLNGIDRTSISVSDWPSGVYFLQGTQGSQKFSILH